MPCVKGAFPIPGQNAKQPLIQISLYNPDNKKADYDPHSVTLPREGVCFALLDTGATISCITKKIADDLGLRIEGEEYIHSVHGNAPTRNYTVGLVIQQIHFMQADLSVFELKTPDNCPYQALLGMDVIGRGVFQVDYNGQFIFCI